MGEHLFNDANADVNSEDMSKSVQSQFMNFSSPITTCHPYLPPLHISKKKFSAKNSNMCWKEKNFNFEFLEAGVLSSNLSGGQMDCSG